jgi:cytochrome P450
MNKVGKRSKMAKGISVDSTGFLGEVQQQLIYSTGPIRLSAEAVAMPEPDSRPPLFDPTHPDFLADPYPAYRLLREHAPVFWADNAQAWVVSRHADVSLGLRDPRFVQDRGNQHLFLTLPPGAPRFETLGRMFGHWMLFQNPPEHTRLRGLVQKAFTPRIVDNLKAPMEQLVDDLLDRAASTGRMDLIADLAFPLPVTVIALMLGVPASDHEQFRRWSSVLAVTMEPIVPLEAVTAADQAAGELMEYFRTLVQRKRSEPGDDLLSALVHAEEHGRRLSLDELLANAVLLLAAGHETTVNLIGNGLLALLRHPEQMERLRCQPGLMRSAVEELLRYDSPVQMTARLLSEDVALPGGTLPAGHQVLLLLGSGNRDPEVFPDPDTLDVTRPDVRPLSFGGGPHYCIGAPLARAEAQVAIGRTLERFPRLKLATDKPQWRPLAVLRGLRQLPVTF